MRRYRIRTAMVERVLALIFLGACALESSHFAEAKAPVQRLLLRSGSLRGDEIYAPGGNIYINGKGQIVTPIYKESQPRHYENHQNSGHDHQSSSSHFAPSNEATADYPQPDPKNYAFAYAVRDGQREGGDDFSHKESRDGKVTMGEYKVLLPDGRTQVVRYTADSKAGFKADVTYEGDPNDNSHLAKLDSQNIPKNHASPKYPPLYRTESTSSVFKKFAAPPNPSSHPEIYQVSPTPSQSGRKPSTIYLSHPLKSHPSISPSLYYKEDIEHHHHHRHPHHRYNEVLASPSPTFLYKVSPSQETPRHSPSPRGRLIRVQKIGSISPSRIPIGYRTVPSPSPTTAIYSPSPSPNSIYRIGVSPTPTYDSSPAYSSNQKPARPHRIVFQHISPSHPAHPAPDVGRYPGNAIEQQDPFKPGTKSRLVPIEFFKAGPATKSTGDYKASASASPAPNYETLEGDYHVEIPRRGTPIKSSVATYTSSVLYPSPSSKPTIYIKSNPHHHHHHHSHHHHENQRQNPSQQQDHYQNPPPQNHYQNHPQQDHYQNSLQQNVYQNAPSQQIYQNAPPQQNHYQNPPHHHHHHHNNPIPHHSHGRRRPSGQSGGLVYLETPAKGPRPSELGVQEILSRLPTNVNVPPPKTTTHPYEVGASDYGKSVSYSTDDKKRSFNNNGQGIPPEFVSAHVEGGPRFARPYSRGYLIDDSEDAIVQGPQERADSSYQHQQQQHEQTGQYNEEGFH